MPNENLFVLAGHLGADPKVENKDGVVFISLRVAWNPKPTEKTPEPKPKWYFVNCSGSSALQVESLGLKKGDGITVWGILDQQSWIDKATQQERTKLALRAQQIAKFINPRKQAPAPAQGEWDPPQKAQTAPVPARGSVAPKVEDDLDCPF